jgi:PadR family transcriptional regulator PadR
MCEGHGHGHGHRHGERRCGPPGGHIRRFVQPRLLLLLARKPAHGYELIEELAEDEGMAIDPALLYRTLHQFEADGLVRSAWDTEGRGPARRVYEITEEGLEYLHTWVVDIRHTRQRLERFLAAYEAQFQEEGR